MTLTDLKSRVVKYWIFIFFAGFLLLFILLYFGLNPSKTPNIPQVTKTLVPQESRPGPDPFANKPQAYQVADNVRTFSTPLQTTDLAVSIIPADTSKIAGVFNFNPESAKELSTDLGPRKIFIDQTRTLAVDSLTITYRNPQNQPGTVAIETIKTLATNTLNSVTPNTKLTLSKPEFHLSTSPTDQTVGSLIGADIITFKILSSANSLPVATDRTPDLSVGSMTFDRSGAVTSFNLMTVGFEPKNPINLITTSDAIDKLINNQSTIIQIKKISGTKTDEEAFQITNFKTINIDTAQLAYYFPTTKNPKNIYPFYVFSGTAISNDDQKYQLLLAVEAVIKTQ